MTAFCQHRFNNQEQKIDIPTHPDGSQNATDKHSPCKEYKSQSNYTRI